MKKNKIKNNILPESFESMDDMNRRSFLEYSIKLTALMAAAPMMKAEVAQAQTISSNAPIRFVNFFIRSGSCQLASYLSPTANITDLTSLPTTWKNPGLATSFRPSAPAKAAAENVDYSNSTNYGTPAQGSQPIYHARTTVGSYNLPLLWSSLIPVGATGSGTTPMKSLISTNCAMIYGLESAPAHPLAEGMLLDPEPGASTVGGYIAASSPKAFFAALANNRGIRPFKSPNGSGIRFFQGNSSNSGPAADVLNSVLPNSSETGTVKRREWLSAISGKMMGALESLRITNMSLKPGISELYHLLTDAKTAVDQETYTAVINDFNVTLQKYLNLRNRAVSMAATSIQGITDSATNATVTRDSLRFYEDTNKKVITVPKNAFQAGNCSASDEFAYIFAFAEVALRNDLSHVLQLGFGEGMVSLKYIESLNYPIGHGIDNHGRGVMANLMSGSLFYYVFNTMLYELKRNIQGITSNPSDFSTATNIEIRYNDLSTTTGRPTPTPAPSPWRDTVMLINTEFPRNPRQDGTGSDHGYDASNVTLISGRIPGSLKIFGKTTYGARDSNPAYQGAWGRGSNSMKTPDARYFNTKDVGSSLAGLFVRGTADAGLQTLQARSANLFYLDSSGNIVFNTSIIPDYSNNGLVST